MVFATEPVNYSEFAAASVSVFLFSKAASLVLATTHMLRVIAVDHTENQDNHDYSYDYSCWVRSGSALTFPLRFLSGCVFLGRVFAVALAGILRATLVTTRWQMWDIPL